MELMLFVYKICHTVEVMINNSVYNYGKSCTNQLLHKMDFIDKENP